ncbi:hypothetical protein BC835DRAFT_1416470 [Cytidiella melzeri]|nr:hypothetical protein BC835DRAFT_1416470 [Cytidiella melzeri]
MNSRYAHRKRPSTLRLSTDSTLSPLPLYTTAIVQDPLDRPPDYPDSAEEADVDLDSESDEGIVRYATQPIASPRRRSSAPRSPPPRSKQRSRTGSSDPYLDSLLARSVHALEMSNTLLQSSITTQTTLNSVFGAEDAETSLETHARNLSSRIVESATCADDLDMISRGVDSLLLDEEDTVSTPAEEEDEEDTASRSLPIPNSLSQRRSHLRKPSLDLRNASLNYSNHNRTDLIAPPPRAITMYVDSSESPTSIAMPPTLGMRIPARPPGTPLPPDSHRRPLLLQSQSDTLTSSPKRAVDVLSSYVGSSSTTIISSPSSSFSARTVHRPRSGSSSTSTTTRRSPQIGITCSRSPSHSPTRSSRSQSIRRRDPPREWDTPPIIELPSSSSESSDDKEIVVDRTLTSLRTILQNNPPKEPKGKEREKEVARPALLLSPTVSTPIADTSHATASVSRLFTKARHTHSTRPPSPPRHSSLRGSANTLRSHRERERSGGGSIPQTPISPAPSLSGSWLSVSDALSFKGSSGRSTPNRVTFAELPADTGEKKDRGSPRSRSRSRSRSRKGKGKDVGKGGDVSDGDGPWWMWLLGVNVNPSIAGVPSYVRNEERVSRGAGWAPRPGFGGSIDDWGRSDAGRGFCGLGLAVQAYAIVVKNRKKLLLRRTFCCGVSCIGSPSVRRPPPSLLRTLNERT